jgi:hypothetical protein
MSAGQVMRNYMIFAKNSKISIQPVINNFIVSVKYEKIVDFLRVDYEALRRHLLFLVAAVQAPAHTH